MASGAKPVGAAAGQRVHAIAAGNKYQNPGRCDGPQYLSDPSRAAFPWRDGGRR